jgi:zinc D-Ala-D-Ala dipeptidase
MHLSLNQKLLLKFLAVIAIITPFCSKAQDTPLEVIHHIHAYRQMEAADTMQKMVAVNDLAPGFKVDMKYATANNFTRQQLYPDIHQVFVRRNVAAALVLAQKQLATKGVGIKFWDGYRPYRVTKKMWELVKDERYVANPSKGSGHNRGIAVDVTLIELTTGQELDMGTGFDNFSDTAHHSFTGLSSQQINNRNLLKTTMEQFGFKPLATEWWHYSWPNAANFPVLDLSFRQLARVAD